MAKLTYEEAQEKLAELKASKKEVTAELQGMRRKHKLKKGETPKEAKDAKAFEKVLAKQEKLAGQVTETTETVKELKPRKERSTKYDYPMVTDEKGKERAMDKEEKKKFRASQRAAAKRAEKEANGETKKATKKTAKKEEAPVKKKRAPRKKKAATTED